MDTNQTNNCNLVKDDLIALTEVKTWNIDALKDFCRKRGYKITGSKDELSARVYFLYNNQIPEEPGAKQQEASRKMDYKTLHNAVVPTIDPARLSKWINEKDGISQWPPVSYIEIVQFLLKHGQNLTADALTSYKTGKGFSYFYNGFLQEVFYHPIKKDSLVCYLKSTCTPSNRLNDTPHNLWTKIEKHSGTILSAFCSCVAG